MKYDHLIDPIEEFRQKLLAEPELVVPILDGEQVEPSEPIPDEGASGWSREEAEAAYQAVSKQKSELERERADLEKELAGVATDPVFARIESKLQARALFMEALTVVMRGMLEGRPGAEIAASCRKAASRAFSIDRKADEGWDERVSPRILSILAAFKAR